MHGETVKFTAHVLNWSVRSFAFLVNYFYTFLAMNKDSLYIILRRLQPGVF